MLGTDWLFPPWQVRFAAFRRFLGGVATSARNPNYRLQELLRHIRPSPEPIQVATICHKYR